MGRYLALAGILAANCLSIVLAVVLGWDTMEILAVYWWQSVIIGVFAVLRLLTLPLKGDRDASCTPGAVKPSSETGNIVARVFLAGFFSLHYGGFHVGYLMFLTVPAALAGAPYVSPDALVMGAFLPAMAFVPGHLVSYLTDLRGTGVDGKAMQSAFWSPYARVIPMHLTIILGVFLASVLPVGIGYRAVLVAFMVLKTIMDLASHARQHAAAKLPQTS